MVGIVVASLWNQRVNELKDGSLLVCGQNRENIHRMASLKDRCRYPNLVTNVPNGLNVGSDKLRTIP